MKQSKELKQVRDALDKWDNEGRINHEELCLFIEAARAYLELQIAAPTPEQTEIHLDGLKQLLKDEGYYSPDGFGMLNHLAATGRLKV